MRNFLFIPFLCMFSVCCYAQKTDTVYFDGKWKQVPKEGCFFYRIIHISADSTNYNLTDYLATGEVQMTGNYKSLVPPVKQGDFTYYFRNGRKQALYIYSNDSTKRVTEWDEQGKMISDKEISGVLSLNDGKEVDQFMKEDTFPVFAGGTGELYQFIERNYRYPVRAPKGRMGKIMVSFTVTTSGKLENVKLLSGLHPLLDEEAMRVVRSFPDWIPGRQNGRLVNVKMTMPISVHGD